MIVDSHCHLNYFSEKELEDIIVKGEENNVRLFNTICTTIKEFPTLLEITKSYKQVFTSVGIHPNNSAKGELISFKELLPLTKHDKVIGIGETGLDFYKCNEEQKQQESFLVHIQASQETNLPIIIHSRNSDNKMIEILESEMRNKEFFGLMHCFSSSKELAFKAIDLGLYISFSGIITFKNAKEVQSIAKSIPLERLLIETDSPFLSPEPHRGIKNNPSMLRYILTYLAGLLNKTEKEISDITTHNFFQLFKKCFIHYHANS